MRVLVTGGTGYLGRAIVRALIARGHAVVVFGRTAERSGLPCMAINGDVRDAIAFQRAAEGCEALVHAAGLVSLWQSHPEIFDEVNIGGLENAVEAARRAGLRRLVYTSSFLALPPAGRTTPLTANDYQRTKAEALARARHHRAGGLPMVVLIPGVVYGPGLRTEGNLVGRLLADHLAGKLPGIVGAHHVWSFAFVDDVAESHVAALERDRPEGEYGVGGENRPQVAIFEWLRDRTGRPLPRHLPAFAATAAGWFEECRARVWRGQPLITRGAVEIFGHDWPVDSHTATRDLGHRIRPLADGLALTIGQLAS